MHEAYYFVLALLAVVAVICMAFGIDAIRNPRRAWDRQHGRDVKNGEPTDESLERIRRNAWFGVVLMPIVFALAYALSVKFERDQQRLAKARQDQQREMERRPAGWDSKFGETNPSGNFPKPKHTFSEPPGTSAANQLPPVEHVAALRVRLARAFETLRRQGLVAEPNFEFSARDAVAGMSALLEQRNATGGVYWHEQDDENLERGEDLHIGFLGREDRYAAGIAQKLVAALRAEGLTVEWDGSAEKRVTVKVLWSMAHPPTTFQPRVRLERVAHIPGTEKGLQGGLAVQGKYVYWSRAGELRVIDVSDPTKPQVVGTLEIENLSDWVSVSGKYAYVVDDERLLVLDVADPAAPRVVGSCDVGAEVQIWGMAVQGQYAYATDGGSVIVIDVSDPAAPKEVGRGKVECGEGITVAGNYAYLPCDSDGMHIVDISDPRAPKHVSAFRGSAGALHVTVVGKLAYITGGEDGIELNIVDISDPKQPKAVGRLGDGMSGGVAVQGDFAYIAAGNLDVVDVSNPATPKLVGFYRDDECMTAWRVAVAGEYAYVLGDGKPGFSVFRAVWTDRDGKEPEVRP